MSITSSDIFSLNTSPLLSGNAKVVLNEDDLAFIKSQEETLEKRRSRCFKSPLNRDRLITTTDELSELNRGKAMMHRSSTLIDLAPGSEGDSDSGSSSSGGTDKQQRPPQARVRERCNSLQETTDGEAIYKSNGLWVFNADDVDDDDEADNGGEFEIADDSNDEQDDEFFLNARGNTSSACESLSREPRLTTISEEADRDVEDKHAIAVASADSINELKQTDGDTADVSGGSVRRQQLKKGIAFFYDQYIMSKFQEETGLSASHSLGKFNEFKKRYLSNKNCVEDMENTINSNADLLMRRNQHLSESSTQSSIGSAFDTSKSLLFSMEGLDQNVSTSEQQQQQGCQPSTTTKII